MVRLDVNHLPAAAAVEETVMDPISRLRTLAITDRAGHTPLVTCYESSDFTGWL